MHSSGSGLTHLHLPWASLSLSSSALVGDESNLSQMALIWKWVALESFRAHACITLMGWFMHERFFCSLSVCRLSSRSRASLVIDRSLLEVYVAVGQHQKVGVNVVNKWMKQIQLWCKQQVLLLLSGGIASEPDWAPGEAAWASGQSNRGSQRPGFATCLCHPLPASPQANHLFSPPSLDCLYFCILSVRSSREGLLFTAASGIRDTTNTKIIGCQFAE